MGHMNIFAVPKMFCKMLRTRAESPNKFKSYPTAWFFSSEGKQAYDCANSLPDRILYFQKYLDSLPIEHKTFSKDIYKIACIMADAMDYSGLCFAGYPNILMPEYNPLIRFLLDATSKLDNSYLHITAADLLCALHGGTDYTKYSSYKGESYKNLLPLSESSTAMYLIEREIIWAFYDNPIDSDDIIATEGSPYLYSYATDLYSMLGVDPEKLYFSDACTNAFVRAYNKQLLK